MKQFRFGKAFPVDSVVSRFILILATIHNDLTVPNSRLIEALVHDSFDWAGLYDFRLVCSHVREAAKLLDAAPQEPAIAQFIDTLPLEAQANYERVRKTFTPWQGSFVQVWLKPVRDALLHYPSMDDGRLAEVVAALSDQMVTDKVPGLASSNYNWGFAGDIALNLGFGTSERSTVQMDDAELSDHMKYTLSRLAEGVKAFLTFSQCAIEGYLEAHRTT